MCQVLETLEEGPSVEHKMSLCCKVEIFLVFINIEKMRCTNLSLGALKENQTPAGSRFLILNLAVHT